MHVVAHREANRRNANVERKRSIMSAEAISAPELQDIFARLATRGITAIEYAQIKSIVMFDWFQRSTYFEQHFRGHTPAQALRLAWKWKQLLQRDFILRAFLSEEHLQDITMAVERAETLAWPALLEMSFPSVGDWELYMKGSPTQESRPMDTTILAVNRKSGETRRAMIPGSLTGKAWMQNLQQAFADLKLLKVLLKTAKQRPLVSAEHPKAWPIFTQLVIPTLYEFMLPFYRKPGHLGSQELVPREAYYPSELFEDMLAILQMEHPDVFRDSTTAPLKAAVQRFRESGQSY